MRSKKLAAHWIRLVVAGMLAATYLLVWLAGGTSSAVPHLFYVPIILSALALSWQESLITAVLSGLLLSEWLMPLNRSPLIYQTTGNWLVRLSSFAVIALWTGIVMKVLEKRSNAYQEFAQLHRASLLALVDLTELRDSSVTGKHVYRLHHYTDLLTEHFNFNQNQEMIISWSIAFHDIGKVAVPDSILNKRGPLTDEEWDVMRQHPLDGAKIIDTIRKRVKVTDPYVLEFLQVTRNIVLYHHEKYDGSGYPVGLKGDQIPFYVRIATLCDVYDSLRSKRPYKEAFSHEEAMELIVSESGTRFDPVVIEAFINLADEFDKIWVTYSDPEYDYTHANTG
ncbi:MAG: HD domain-containing protein [Firmicutes bacterium]|jgi:HD-GYP domain-containing protein (c-di-GMP phosphodiesterase class II)|nr:HD domain-containing phosphohydrolase [Bacillota bacterium]NLL88738.1 HD domain-containing protein [Bacillota bacterium]